MKIFKISILLLLILFIQNAIAEKVAPSFDCSKSFSKVEKEICANPELSKLDKKLDEAYSELKQHPDGRIKGPVADLVKNQKQWIEKRNQFGSSQDANVEWLTVLYRDRVAQLSFPGAPVPLSDQNVKVLAAYFEDKSCETFETLSQMEMLNSDGQDQFACKIYEFNPSIGSKLFSNCYGGNRDNFTPRCSWENIQAETKKIDGLDEFLKLLLSLSGLIGDSGTLQYGKYKNQQTAIMLASHDSQISPNLKEIDLNTDYKKFKNKPYPCILHYSWKGLWEQDQYKKYLNLRNKTQHSLEQYYINIKKVQHEKAKELAAYHVIALTDTYLDAQYHRDNWGLNEVDDFLKTGKLPDDLDYNYSSILYDGADIHISKEEATPDILAYFLKLAIVNQYSKKDIEKIIDAGARIDTNKKVSTIVDSDVELEGGRLAEDTFMNAVRRPDILRLLIERGANINAQNTFGKTPLMYAIQFGNLESIKILLEHGADINLATFPEKTKYSETMIKASNRTPLMYAAWHANSEIVKFLLAKGANPNIKDSEGHDYKYYLEQNDYGKL